MKTKLLLSAAFCFCLISNTQAQTLPAYLPTNGLVGWWPFNGNANDESGNGNDGTVNGAALTSDRFGSANNAYDFNPLSSTITTSLIGPTGRSPRSISLWFSIDLENTSNDQWVMMRYGGNSEFEGFTLSVWPTPNFGVAVDIGASYMVYGPSPIGSYHHLVATYDSSNGNTLQAVKMYLDGMLLGDVIENNGVFTINTGDSNPIRFGPGDSPISDLQTFKGKLDDIAIYNRALSQEEITALYTGEPVNPPTACNPLPSNLQNGLVGYWPFCGNANDESGNGNDGTVNGATLTEDRFGMDNAAYDFDGVDDWIQVQNDSTLNLSGDLSISSWLNADSYDLISMIVSKHSPLCDNNLGTFVYGIWDDGGVGNFKTNFSASPIFTAETYPNNNASVSENNWYNFIATYSNNLQVLKYYLNGDLVDTINIDFDITTNPFDLYIGKQDCSNTWHFNGTLDDIGIWNRALTSEEVQQLYTLNACTFSIYDTTYVTIYDTVSVSTTDTLIINTLITGVQPAQENTFLVYPNPTGSQITINNGNVSILGGYTMRISNSIGQEVYNQNITQTEVTLDLSNWGGNGLYVLYILDPQGEIIAVKQIVLQ